MFLFYLKIIWYTGYFQAKNAFEVGERIIIAEWGKIVRKY